MPLTEQQLERFKKAMGDLVERHELAATISALDLGAPAGPFTEFIKRIHKHNQIPACKTCIHYNGAHFCAENVDWHEKKPTGFCEEWNPEQPGEKTNG